MGISLIPILLLFLIYILQLLFINTPFQEFIETVKNVPNSTLFQAIGLFTVLIGIIYAYYSKLPAAKRTEYRNNLSELKVTIPGTFLFTTASFGFYISGVEPIDKIRKDFSEILEKEEFKYNQYVENEVYTHNGKKLLGFSRLEGHWLNFDDENKWQAQGSNNPIAFIFNTTDKETAWQACKFLSTNVNFADSSWSILKDNGEFLILTGHIGSNKSEFIKELFQKHKFFEAAEYYFFNQTRKLKIQVHWVNEDITDDDLIDCKNYKKELPPLTDQPELQAGISKNI